MFFNHCNFDTNTGLLYIQTMKNGLLRYWYHLLLIKMMILSYICYLRQENAMHMDSRYWYCASHGSIRTFNNAFAVRNTELYINNANVTRTVLFINILVFASYETLVVSHCLKVKHRRIVWNVSRVSLLKSKVWNKMHKNTVWCSHNAADFVQNRHRIVHPITRPWA